MKIAPHARLAVYPPVLAAAFPLAFLAASPALSQTDQTTQIAQAAQVVAPRQLTEMVVSATRSAQPIGDVVADVTLIDRETIERAGPVGLADILARVPGVQITRNGGIGANTSVFVRGGESRHTPVFIDGVRVESQATAGGASWSNIPIALIDRIEVLRGPSSAVYGSDAVAGVIQIFTKRGEGPFSPSVTVGYGSYNTSRVELAASGSAGAFDYALGLSQGQSDGFNARTIAAQNPDADGYKSLGANAKLGFQLNPDHRIEANVLQSHTDSQYDGGPTRDYRRISDLQTLGLQWEARWSDRYSTKLAVTQGTDSGEEGLNGSTPQISYDRSRISTLLFQNEYRLGAHLLSAALESRRDVFRLVGSTVIPGGASVLNKDRSLDGVSLGYGWSGGAHTVQLNARHDRDSEFGGKTTGSAAYAFALTPQWKASASAGTSFRVPTLYQRFSIYGSSTLKPESGRSVEAALKYSQGTSQYGVTVYRNRLTNLLSFVNGNGPCINGGPPTVLSNRACYANTAQAEYTGLTLTAAETLGNVRIHGSLDLQNPKNRVTNRTLQRRSRQYGTLGAEMPLGGWQLATDLVMASHAFDSDNTNVVLPGYSVVNLSATTALSRDWKLAAKLENLADKVYQTANTYATARRTLYVGLTWAPR
ncbi:TonB-dependent receptor domain-containing protein [Polaromonas sp. LjRoot131]|uniref:TonB-dependent receptor domain-containing protein n=1 Tax=Polaromonas sp. LjRoot131 TaxID=3342262 RepID=UPI003ED16AAB